MNNIFKNYRKQKVKSKELIIVLNDKRLNVRKWKKEAKKYKNVSIFQVGAEKTLGECCNLAIKKANYSLIAKFDDDDYYSSKYLAKDIKAFDDPTVQVTGKATHFIYFKKKKLLAIRKTDISSPLMGGTLIFRKEVTRKVKFQSVNVGEDTYFLKDCQKNGYKLHYSTMHNYVYIRYDNSHHTWKTSEKKLLRSTEHICKTKNFRRFVKS